MNGDVPEWAGLDLYKPTLELTATTSGAAVLSALADGLGAAHFRVSRRSDRGFRARYFRTGEIVGAIVSLDVSLLPSATVLEVTLLGDDAGRSTVRVTAKPKGGSRQREDAARGLSAGVGSLRVQGVEVSWTPWRKHPDRTD